MKNIIGIIAAILFYLLIQIEADKHNPCSNFSATPGQCSSGLD